MRSNPADLKEKGAKTDGRYGTRTVWTGCRDPLKEQKAAYQHRMFPRLKRQREKRSLEQ